MTSSYKHRPPVRKQRRVIRYAVSFLKDPAHPNGGTWAIHDRLHNTHWVSAKQTEEHTAARVAELNISKEEVNQRYLEEQADDATEV